MGLVIAVEEIGTVTRHGGAVLGKQEYQIDDEYWPRMLKGNNLINDAVAPEEPVPPSTGIRWGRAVGCAWAALLVRPETLLGWHRDLVGRKCAAHGQRPRAGTASACRGTPGVDPPDGGGRTRVGATFGSGAS